MSVFSYITFGTIISGLSVFSFPESYFVSVFSYITFGTIISGLMFIFYSRDILCECIFLYHIWD